MNRFEVRGRLLGMREWDESRVHRTLLKLREKPVRVFGAGAHGFQLNPTLPETAVSDFERRYGVKLPADYRKFITSIGNGGAGPCYGIFPLGYADDAFDLSPWRQDDGRVGELSEPFPFSEEWNDLSGKPSIGLNDSAVGPEETEYDRQWAAFEKVYWGSTLVNGAIPICDEGCALRIYLVVTGAQEGKLWEDRRAEYAGLRPVRLKDGSAATFRLWYEEWLEECLAE